jgi:hypothetical protein
MNKRQSTNFKFFAVIMMLFAVQIVFAQKPRVSKPAQKPPVNKAVIDTYECYYFEKSEDKIKAEKYGRLMVNQNGTFTVLERNKYTESPEGKYTIEKDGIIQFNGVSADESFYRFKAIPSQTRSNRFIIKPEDSWTSTAVCVLTESESGQKIVDFRDSIYLFNRTDYFISENEKAEILKEQTELGSGKPNSETTATANNTTIKDSTSSQNQTAPIKYQIGQKVEAMDYGVWYRAEIIKIESNGRYVIRFEGTNGNDGSIASEYLRPLTSSSTAQTKQVYSSPLWVEKFGISESELSKQLLAGTEYYYEGCRQEFTSLFPPRRLETAYDRAFAEVSQSLVEEKKLFVAVVIGKPDLNRIKLTGITNGQSQYQNMPAPQQVTIGKYKANLRAFNLFTQDDSLRIETAPDYDDYVGVFRFSCTGKKAIAGRKESDDLINKTPVFSKESMEADAKFLRENPEYRQKIKELLELQSVALAYTRLTASQRGVDEIMETFKNEMGGNISNSRAIEILNEAIKKVEFAITEVQTINKLKLEYAAKDLEYFREREALYQKLLGQLKNFQKSFITEAEMKECVKKTAEFLAKVNVTKTEPELVEMCKVSIPKAKQLAEDIKNNPESFNKVAEASKGSGETVAMAQLLNTIQEARKQSDVFSEEYFQANEQNRPEIKRKMIERFQKALNELIKTENSYQNFTPEQKVTIGKYKNYYTEYLKILNNLGK